MRWVALRGGRGICVRRVALQPLVGRRKRSKRIIHTHTSTHSLTCTQTQQSKPRRTDVRATGVWTGCRARPSRATTGKGNGLANSSGVCICKKILRKEGQDEGGADGKTSGANRPQTLACAKGRFLRVALQRHLSQSRRRPPKSNGWVACRTCAVVVLTATGCCFSFSTLALRPFFSSAGDGNFLIVENIPPSVSFQGEFFLFGSELVGWVFFVWSSDIAFLQVSRACLSPDPSCQLRRAGRNGKQNQIFNALGHQCRSPLSINWRTKHPTNCLFLLQPLHPEHQHSKTNRRMLHPEFPHQASKSRITDMIPAEPPNAVPWCRLLGRAKAA